MQSWYRQCYDTAVSSLAEIESVATVRPREDKIHGALLVMAELLRCANADWERINRELEELIPHARNSSSHFNSSNIDHHHQSMESSGFMNVLSSDKQFSAGGGVASLKGAMRRYYQSGLSRHSPSASGGTQIPFNWFGSVPIGKEQIVESALVMNITPLSNYIC